MSTIVLQRTDSDDPDFQNLVVLLDRDLKIRDGEEHGFYAQYNGINAIKHAVVAYENDVPVGCGAIRIYAESETENKANMLAGQIISRRMFVHPEARGRGIATSVLKELELWAKEVGCFKLILETGLAQPEAIALYNKNGYLVMPNYGQYAGVDNSVCMFKAFL